MSQLIVTLFAVVGFILGYVRQDFGLMITIFGAGVGVAFIAAVFDWPFYNRNPVSWRRPEGGQPSTKSGRSSSTDAAPQGMGTISNFWGLFK